MCGVGSADVRLRTRIPSKNPIIIIFTNGHKYKNYLQGNGPKELNGDVFALRDPAFLSPLPATSPPIPDLK
jgi:hypothetical protein